MKQNFLYNKTSCCIWNAPRYYFSLSLKITRDENTSFASLL